ncbi:MAG: hypothetical protein H0X30_17295 [Anaerolineae bacterium]|nr:hypothetical protein [Anaerolineae bacterium]
MTVFDGELEVIGCGGMTEHDAVKTFVIFKRGDDFQAESITIKAQDVGHVVGRAGNAQMRVHSDLQINRY